MLFYKISEYLVFRQWILYTQIRPCRKGLLKNNYSDYFKTVSGLQFPGKRTLKELAAEWDPAKFFCIVFSSGNGCHLYVKHFCGFC